LNRAIVLSIS